MKEKTKRIITIFVLAVSIVWILTGIMLWAHNNGLAEGKKFCESSSKLEDYKYLNKSPVDYLICVMCDLT